MPEVPVPQWVIHSGEYVPVQPDLEVEPFQTSVTSAAFTASIAVHVLTEERKQMHPNILEVGVGWAMGPLYGSIEPFYLMAALSDRRPRLTVVENNPQAIQVVRDQKFVGCPQTKLRQTSETYEAWRRYLQLTMDREIPMWAAHESSDMFFGPIPFDDEQEAEALMLFANGIQLAPLPETYLMGIRSGRVRLVEADIATADLSGYSPFDFVCLMNVIYYLPPAGQKRAMYSIARAMAPQATLLLSDRSGRGYFPLLEENGGWMGEQEQSDLGLGNRHVFFEGLVEGVSDPASFMTLEKIDG